MISSQYCLIRTVEYLRTREIFEGGEFTYEHWQVTNTDVKGAA
jgi:hypothetical protein